MRVALVRWREEREQVGDGVELTSFVPDVDLDQLDSWGVIDLRGSGQKHQSSADGVALMVAPHHEGPIPGALVDLGDDHRTRLGSPVARALGNRLGLNLVEASPGRIAAELLTLHARADDDSKPNPLVGERRFPRSKSDQRRRARVWCAGVLLYDELGGLVDEEMAYYEETFVTVASPMSSGAQDLPWDVTDEGSAFNTALVSGDVVAVPPSANTAQRMSTSLGSIDHWAEIEGSTGDSSLIGAMVRMENPSLRRSYSGLLRTVSLSIVKNSTPTSSSDLAFVSTPSDSGTRYTVRLEANGSTLTLKVDGATITSGSDTEYTGTRTGINGWGFRPTRIYSFSTALIGEGPGGGGDPVDAEIAHGIALGHTMSAEATVTATASHGIALTHGLAATVGTPVTATVAHGVALTHEVAAERGATTAQVAHGITLSHQATAEAAVTTHVAHGLVLAHTATVDVTVTATVANGLVLTHETAATVTVATSVAHGVVLGHTLTAQASADATIAHGITVGHQVAAFVGKAIAATISHGITLSHTLTAEKGATTATVAHGIFLAHQAHALVGSAIAAQIAHGILLAHTMTAERGATEAHIGHGIVLGHQATVDVQTGVRAAIGQGVHLGHAATIRAAVTAAVLHGLALRHQAAVIVGAAPDPNPLSITIRETGHRVVVRERGGIRTR